MGVEKIKYVAYGSNLLTERLTAMGRVPSAKFIEKLKITGWKLRFNKKSKDGSGKCNIVKGSETDYVWGAVYELNKNEKTKLDGAEGKGTGMLKRSI